MLKQSQFDNVEKPKHYHSYKMDTLTFLKNGFPKEVLEGFCVGSIIKYVQRYDLKNGVEDLKKARFYLDTLIELKEKDAK